MNKIIIKFGLLVFFLAVIFFSRIGIPLQDVVFRSFLVFIVLTVMISLVALLFTRSVNKISRDKQKDLTQNLSRK
jgi:membrane protein implicated in regulation of membrane protease activity